MSVSAQKRRMMAVDLITKKHRGEKIVTLTAYDYGTAKLLDQTNQVDCILVGDSLGMVMLGYADTRQVTMADMLHHCKAVARGVERALLVVDMPFLSTHGSFEQAIKNVGRMIQEGQAQAVKIEGASPDQVKLITYLFQAGIPVMGHLGFTPQSVETLGGYKVQGKTTATAQQLLKDAKTLEAAGIFALVLEMVPQEVSAWISQELSIPTIGIGAGPGCDGQVLVIDDLIGKYPNFKPRFARTYFNFANALEQAVTQFAHDILSQDFPHPIDESFSFAKERLGELEALKVSTTQVGLKQEI